MYLSLYNHHPPTTLHSCKKRRQSSTCSMLPNIAASTALDKQLLFIAEYGVWAGNNLQLKRKYLLNTKANKSYLLKLLIMLCYTCTGTLYCVRYHIVVLYLLWYSVLCELSSLVIPGHCYCHTYMHMLCMMITPYRKL